MRKPLSNSSPTARLVRITHLIAAATKPDDGRLPPLLDVFKLITCDACCPEEGATLQDTYDARVREEELQTPVELAREIVRSEDQRTARRNARLIIQQLKRISPEKLIQMERDEGNVINAICERVSHPPPA